MEKLFPSRDIVQLSFPQFFSIFKIILSHRTESLLEFERQNLKKLG